MTTEIWAVFSHQLQIDSEEELMTVPEAIKQILTVKINVECATLGQTVLLSTYLDRNNMYPTDAVREEAVRWSANQFFKGIGKQSAVTLCVSNAPPPEVSLVRCIAQNCFRFPDSEADTEPIIRELRHCFLERDDELRYAGLCLLLVNSRLPISDRAVIGSMAMNRTCALTDEAWAMAEDMIHVAVVPVVLGILGQKLLDSGYPDKTNILFVENLDDCYGFVGTTSIYINTKWCPSPLLREIAGRLRAEEGRLHAEEGRLHAEEGRLHAQEGRLLEKQRTLDVTMELLTLKQLNCHRGEDAVQGKSEMTALQGEMTALQGEMKALQGEMLALQGEMKALQGEMLALQGEMKALQKALDLSMAIVVAHEMAHLILRRELHDANAHTPNLDVANNPCVNDFLRSADIDECGFLVEYVLFGFNFDIERHRS